MTATLLSNGQVLVAGGINAANNPIEHRVITGLSRRGGSRNGDAGK
jgi:hypothetical protein